MTGHQHSHGPTRRSFLAGTAALGVGLALPRGARADEARVIRSKDGLIPLANAMHIHTSFSEGAASFGAQLAEAARTNTDVLWKTDHDWRELAHGAPDHLGFSTLSGELVGGRPMTWTPQTKGGLKASTCAIVTAPVSSADDPATPGALHLLAQGSNANPAAQLVYGDFSASRYSQRTSLLGQRFSLDVLSAVSGDSYLEVRLALSNQPASGGRAAGQYLLSYRLGDHVDGRETQQLLGIVYKQIPANSWTTVTFDPVSDISRLWPDIVSADNSLNDLWLGVTSVGRASASGYFDNLKFSRQVTTPDAVLNVERALKRAYAHEYPHIAMPRGREISYFENHVTAYGPGAEFFPDLSSFDEVGVDDPGWSETAGYVAQVQQRGGVAGFTHPFGASQDPHLMRPASYPAALAKVFADLFQHDVCGADLLEVGYQQRGGVRVGGQGVVVDLATHQALWDMLSRNGYYLTANGVSDNHDGGDGGWSDNENRFLTYTWARSAQEDDLLDPLRAGRVYAGELGGFAGTLDLLVDELVPMGGVSVRPDLASRTLRVMATGVPAGGGVRVVQGPIDHPGAGTTSPGTTTVAQLSADDLRAGSATLRLDTSVSSFARLDVLDANGRIVGFSNPVYLLRERSQRTVPAARRSPDSRR